MNQCMKLISIHQKGTHQKGTHQKGTHQKAIKLS